MQEDRHTSGAPLPADAPLMVFITKRGRYFHVGKCAGKFRHYRTAREAWAAGFLPCKVCLPGLADVRLDTTLVRTQADRRDTTIKTRTYPTSRDRRTEQRREELIRRGWDPKDLDF